MTPVTGTGGVDETPANVGVRASEAPAGWVPEFEGQRPPFAPGNKLAVRHGAHSEPVVRREARTHKRRLLRQIGLRLSDLDGVGQGYLDVWARSASKVALFDRYMDEHGLVQENGQPWGFMALYVSLLNASRLSLTRLEAHLQTRRGPSALERHLAEHYSDEGDA
jgi:hypothetical protein